MFTIVSTRCVVEFLQLQVSYTVSMVHSFGSNIQRDIMINNVVKLTRGGIKCCCLYYSVMLCLVGSSKSYSE
eukprot:1159519-Amphidinium_carterae.1